MAVYDEADTAAISDYVFMGSATISGIFLDSNGYQIGDGFTGAASTTVPRRLWEIAGLSGHPAGAVGAKLNFSADAYYRVAESDGFGSLADFTTNYATRYPKQVGPAYNVGFGKVR